MAGEGQQEEELHQRVAVVHHQLVGRLHEGHAIGDPVADEEYARVDTAKSVMIFDNALT